ncbi:hypothetical protein ACFVT1_02170 [Streptomyces sp. NPDC057963]|uniref:hypothetical protein n=1 Tax=Streptomyces sp. NPDC057963 TaxID=3346290 RepID=UPI0036E85367
MVGEDRHAKVDQLRPTIGRRSLEAVGLGHRSVEADLESLDLAEPVVGTGLADTFSEVLGDLDEAWPLAAAWDFRVVSEPALASVRIERIVVGAGTAALGARQRHWVDQRAVAGLDPEGVEAADRSVAVRMVRGLWRSSR